MSGRRGGEAKKRRRNSPMKTRMRGIDGVPPVMPPAGTQVATSKSRSRALSSNPDHWAVHSARDGISPSLRSARGPRPVRRR